MCRIFSLLVIYERMTKMNKCKRLLCLILALATVLSISAVGFTASAAELEVVEVSAATPASASDFTWDNATVYFLLTDRFQNGNIPLRNL